MLYLKIIFLMILLDYISGVLVALMNRSLNSKIGRKGIFSKIGMLLCTLLFLIIDKSEIPGIEPLLPMISIFFIINESISIIENLEKLGVPIPEEIKNKIKRNY